MLLTNQAGELIESSLLGLGKIPSGLRSEAGVVSMRCMSNPQRRCAQFSSTRAGYSRGASVKNRCTSASSARTRAASPQPGAAADPGRVSAGPALGGAAGAAGTSNPRSAAQALMRACSSGAARRRTWRSSNWAYQTLQGCSMQSQACRFCTWNIMPTCL